MPLRAQPDGPQYPDLHEMRTLAFVYLRAALYVVNDRGGSQFSLVAHIRGAPNNLLIYGRGCNGASACRSLLLGPSQRADARRQVLAYGPRDLVQLVVVLLPGGGFGLGGHIADTLAQAGGAVDRFPDDVRVPACRAVSWIVCTSSVRRVGCLRSSGHQSTVPYASSGSSPIVASECACTRR